MRASEFITEVQIDNQQGWGQVPYNQDVDYFGLRVAMRPSVFLKLARPLKEPKSVDYITQHLENGGALGAPFLTVEIPESWLQGKFPDYAQVRGHEGRNRMMAIQKVEGDNPVEVHIFPRELRARHLTPEIIEQLQVAMIAEAGGVVFGGGGRLLFDVM